MITFLIYNHIIVLFIFLSYTPYLIMARKCSSIFLQYSKIHFVTLTHFINLFRETFYYILMSYYFISMAVILRWAACYICHCTLYSVHELRTAVDDLQCSAETVWWLMPAPEIKTVYKTTIY